MLNPRRVLPHSLIYDRVWGYDFGPTSNALRVYVGYLRRKLEDAGARPLIHTVRGVGYALPGARAVRAMSLRVAHGAGGRGRGGAGRDRGRRVGVRRAPARQCSVSSTHSLHSLDRAGASSTSGRRPAGRQRRRAGPRRRRRHRRRAEPERPDRATQRRTLGRRRRLRPGARDRRSAARPFGGAAGARARWSAPTAATCRATGRDSDDPRDRRAQALARSGRGQLLHRHDGQGHRPPRAGAPASAGRGALLVALPLDGRRHTLWTSELLLLVLIIAAAGIAAGGAARVSGGADRAGPDRPLHPPDGDDRRQPRAARAASGWRSTGGDELARLAQTFNATLDALESSIAGPAQPRRRRLARAAHADRHDPRQPAADARRAAAAARGSRGAAART